MKLVYTERFQRSFAEAPAEVRAQAQKALALLLRDLRHPSLRAKKYDETRSIWQGRVNRRWRFYFTIEGDLYFLVDIMSHPK